jgi:hypothetical protein
MSGRGRRRGYGTNRREIVTVQSQTRAPERAIVDREGGGTSHPTLGGGCGVAASADAAAEGVVR